MSELSAAGAEYLVVGGFAIAAHVIPRSPGDIDVWVRADASNAQRVWLCSPRSEHRSGALPRRILRSRVLRPRSALRRYATEIDGVTFDEAWKEREHLKFEGVIVPFISMDHLLRNKKASARPKDLADVVLLEAEQSTKRRVSSDDA